MNIICDKTLLSAAIDGVSKAVTLLHFTLAHHISTARSLYTDRRLHRLLEFPPLVCAPISPTKGG